MLYNDREKYVIAHVDYIACEKIGYNLPDGRINNAYYIHIAQKGDSPYYINFYFGTVRLLLTTAQTLDGCIDTIKGLEFHTIIWYLDYCTLDD